MKKIIFAIFILVFCRVSVSALTYGGCDVSAVARMKQIASNINVVYDYRIVNDTAYFDITISNLTKDIYVYNSYFKQNAFGSNGEVVLKGVRGDSVTLNFYSNKNECRGLLLGTNYLSFPIFNKYYDDQVCEKANGIVQCSKWTQKSYTYDEVNAAVKTYLENMDNQKEIPTTVTYKKTLFDKIVDFYVRYYLVFLLGVIAICVTIIIINKKKNEFKI